MSVILISIDGLRPDALLRAGCCHLLRFRDRGAYTMCASSVIPSLTLPCHTSIFHSVPPTRHGITTNSWQPMAHPLPGLIKVAHQHGKHCAFFYSWEQLRDLSQPGQLEYTYFANNGENNGRPNFHVDGLIAAEAGCYIITREPDFAFIYLGTLDIAGHTFGWMSNGYLAQLNRIDDLFGDLLEALPDDCTILVQGDHGGHGREHGTDMLEDITIPWMITGPNIRANYEIQAPVTLLETAPTLARLLNIPPVAQWYGRCLDEIFIR